MSELEIIEIARQRAEAEVAPARALAFERALRELRAERDAACGAATAPADPDEDGLWTVEEVAAYLRKHPNTIYRMAKAGEIPSVLFGARTRRFRPDDVRRFAGRETQGAEIVMFKRRGT